MTTKLISFRLSNTELDWLEQQCESGESLSLAAKRLLLSLCQDLNNVKTYDIREELKELERRLEERFEELESRLWED